MRNLGPPLVDLMQNEGKMAFITGPRQVGKTTLALDLLDFKKSGRDYFNWDVSSTQKAIIKNPEGFWQAETPLPKRIALDEIHKYPRWKRFLKGFYDHNKNDVQTIVTGSGRLDIYQRGGDSLFGRYHLFHLLPFTLGELTHGRINSPQDFLKLALDEPRGTPSDMLKTLWEFNGFPEPLFGASKTRLNRWQAQHRNLILRNDIRDLTLIREIGLIEMLAQLLPSRVGSPLSVNSLKEDLGVNHATVQNWLRVLDRLYYLFFLRPFTGRLARSLKMEQKVYFYDWAELQDPGARFENFVALHFFKACCLWTDMGFGDFSLHYVRDKEKREVDFVVCEKGRPWFLIEAKLSAKDISAPLYYFHERLKPKASFQVVMECDSQVLIKKSKDVYLCHASRLLNVLP